MDGFGVIVFVSVIVIGGGILRDMMLDVFVFWIVDIDYFYIILIVVFIFIIWLWVSFRFFYYYLFIVDVFGLVFFNVVGIEKVLVNDIGIVVVIVMGIIIGVFGGLLWDVICWEVFLVLYGEFYVIICIVGGVVYGLVVYFGFVI